MHIFITGGTGLVGSTLIPALLARNHKITVLSRDTMKARKKLGDKLEYCSGLESVDSFDNYDIIINLAGEPIAGKRWTTGRKERLCNSRWDITRRLTKLIKLSNNPPSVFISGSAIGYYGAQNDNIINENSEPHDEFTHQLCKKWEGLAMAADNRHTRVCILRTGIVLSEKGGLLPMLMPPFRLGLGCVLAAGSQYISWIHIRDMVDSMLFMIDTPEARGVFNLSSPNPVTNKRFARILSRTLFRPCLFKIPAFIMKAVMGESATLVVDGQRAIPQHLLDMHYHFSFGHIDEALADILSKKEKRHKSASGKSIDK
jgi:uncharacterized protein (TIGR01777 family)